MLNAKQIYNQGPVVSERNDESAGLETAEKLDAVIHSIAGDNVDEGDSPKKGSSQRQAFPASKVVLTGVSNHENTCTCCGRPV